MARKKQEEAPAGSPAWMATFSDLMNLLLCFFVLLFSMSSVEQEKFDLVVASLQSSFSIFTGGGSSIKDGQMIGDGISQLENLDIYYKEANTQSNIEMDGTLSAEGDAEGSGQLAEANKELTEEELREQYEEASLKESEEMAENIEDMAQQQGIGDKVQIDVTAQYVRLTLNGALLFDPGSAELREEALPLVEKLGLIVSTYADNTIAIEGHTDNVPVSSTSRFEDNDVLASFRARSVKNYFVDHAALDPSRIVYTSYGEHTPVADNGTAEGRALNRRVEIKVYNSFNSR